MTSPDATEPEPSEAGARRLLSPLHGRVPAPGAHPETVDGLEHSGSSLALEILLEFHLTTLGGELRRGRDVVTQRTVLILIDAIGAAPERSAAEVAWVRERLDPDIDLVLIWPADALIPTPAMPVAANARIYRDVQGDVCRLVSPTGKRIAVLADPNSGQVRRVRSDSPIFAVRRAPSGANERGADSTIDLGDVYF